MAAPIVYTDYDSEAENIARRQKYAEALRDQASQALPTGQMVGNRVVPISWTQGLAQALKGYVGHKMSEKASQDRTALAGKRNAALAEVLGAMPKAQNAALPTDQEGTGSFDMSGMAGPMQKLQAPSMSDNAAWLGKVAGLGGNASTLGTNLLGLQQKADEAEANRQSRTMDRIMALESAATQMALSREERAARAKEAADLRRELAGQADARARELAASQDTLRRDLAAQAAAVRRDVAAGRNAQPKPPKDFRWKEDGSMEVIPGSETDRKRTEAKLKDERGKKLLDSTLDAEIANIDKLIGSDEMDETGKPKVPPHKGLNRSVGVIASRLPTLTQDTADAEALQESLRSKASISALQTIRGTAGAIGSLTEKEWPRLEALKATLQASQGTKQFTENLKEYRAELRRIKALGSQALAEGAQSGLSDAEQAELLQLRRALGR